MAPAITATSGALTKDAGWSTRRATESKVGNIRHARLGLRSRVQDQLDRLRDQHEVPRISGCVTVSGPPALSSSTKPSGAKPFGQVRNPDDHLAGADGAVDDDPFCALSCAETCWGSDVPDYPMDRARARQS